MHKNTRRRVRAALLHVVYRDGRLIDDFDRPRVSLLLF